MAMTTNASNTFSMIGIREDLANIVYRIDPEEVPFQSNISTKGKASQRYTEWQVQTLATPSTTNFQLEGDEPAATAATARSRIGNRTAISFKTFAVTTTANVVDVAGISDEMDEQRLLRGLELKRDMEVILLNNNAQAAGGTLTVAECAGLATYITNTDLSAVALYTAATGDGTDAWNFANTTSQALSLTILNSALKSAYVDGGSPSMVLLSPDKKIDFSGLALASSISGAAQVRQSISKTQAAAIVGSVESWLSDFGSLSVTVDRQMASDTAFLDNTAFLVDPKYAEVLFLEGMQSRPLATVGLSDKEMVFANYSLRVGAPKAHAACFVLS
tara:strand:- start:556 stop:1551 length:996 start_codon:yes stop_codon:yes gene_type:complete